MAPSQLPLQAGRMIPEQSLNPHGPQTTHVILDFEPACPPAAAGTCSSVSVWEQWSIDVNVPQSENWNINIKKANRTKFLELHIKTELLQLKQQIKISAEVFW